MAGVELVAGFHRHPWFFSFLFSVAQQLNGSAYRQNQARWVLGQFGETVVQVKCLGDGVLGINDNGIHTHLLTNQGTALDGIYQQNAAIALALLLRCCEACFLR